jgi:hypothetical protein
METFPSVSTFEKTSHLEPFPSATLCKKYRAWSHFHRRLLTPRIWKHIHPRPLTPCRVWSRLHPRARLKKPRTWNHFHRRRFAKKYRAWSHFHPRLLNPRVWKHIHPRLLLKLCLSDIPNGKSNCLRTSSLEQRKQFSYESSASRTSHLNEGVMLGDTSQILITMFIVYNSPSFHLAYIIIYYCLAPTLFRVVASTHSLYLIITGTPLLY